MRLQRNLIYSFIFTLILIIFIIWNRFIRLRFTKNISYHEFWTTYDIIIVIIFFLYLIVFCYYLLKYLKIIPRPKAKIKTFFDNIFLKLERKPFIIKLLEFNKNVIINGPSNVYEFIYQYIYVKPFIWFCGKHLSNNFEERPLTFYVIVFVLPKLVIVLTLFIDVTFFNQIHYFYNSLILYLIPLVFRIILYIINHHAKGYLDLLHEFFSFKLVNDYTELEITNIIFIDKIKLRQQENLLPYAETDWMPLQWMYSITTKINQEKDKYNNITNMIIFGLFTLSFLIYLLKTMGFLLV